MTVSLCAPKYTSRQDALDFLAGFDFDLTVDDLATFEVGHYEFTALEIITRQAELGF